ncbi:MAG: thiamine pyrophosphate-binding protein [Candidatus Brocadiia bacterium]
MAPRSGTVLVAEMVARYLEREGVRYVFGVPGSYILALYDAIHASPVLEAILSKHEQGAALMADGYAKVSGRLACCAATAGPGATNLVTGVATSFMCSQPVLALTGQVPTSYFAKGALQEGTGLGRSIDQAGLLARVTKFSRRVDEPVEAEETLRAAILAARSGRPGPAAVELPIDVLNSRVRFDGPLGHDAEPQVASADDVGRAAALLREARHPVILAGGGALYGDAAEAIAALADQAAIPVATTLKAKGILPEDHPLALGCAGLFGSSAANAYLRDHCDVLLAVGASFHEFTSACYDEELQPKTALIQVDADPAELGKNYPAEVCLLGSARANLAALLEALDRQATPAKQIAGLKKKHRWFDEPATRDDSSPIKPPYLMACLRRCLPRDAIVFSESVTWTERYLPCYGPRTHIVGTGLAPIGYAGPAAIGGQLAAPDRTVVAVAGDGGFQFTAMEVLTAVNHGVPVKWVVLDNGRFASIHDAQSFLYGGRHVASDFRNPDFVALAQAFGARGVRIEEPRGLDDQLRRALAIEGPVLVAVATDPQARPPFKPGVLRRTRAWKAPLPDTRAGTKAVFQMLKER